MLGEAALAWQDRIDTGDQQIGGVNCYRVPEEKDNHAVPPTVRPAKDKMQAHVDPLRRVKTARSQAAAVATGMDTSAAVAGGLKRAPIHSSSLGPPRRGRQEASRVPTRRRSGTPSPIEGFPCSQRRPPAPRRPRQVRK